MTLKTKMEVQAFHLEEIVQVYIQLVSILDLEEYMELQQPKYFTAVMDMVVIQGIT